MDKKRGWKLLTVIGWLGMVLCNLCVIRFLVLHAGDWEPKRLDIGVNAALLAGAVICLCIIYRDKLTRRGREEAAQAASGGYRENGERYVLLLLAASFLFTGAMHLIAGMPYVINFKRTYISTLQLAGVLAAAVVMLLLGSLILVLTIRKGQRVQKPLNKAILVLLAIYVACGPITMIMRYIRVHGYQPDPFLSEEQRDDMTRLMRQAGYDSLPFTEHEDDMAPRTSGNWVAMLMPKDVSLQDDGDSFVDTGEVFAWSDASWWAVEKWTKTKPDASDIGTVETIFLCRYGEYTREYHSGNRVETGLSEYVDICYVNAETKRVFKYERYSPVKLPDAVMSDHAPVYRVGQRQLVDHILAQLDD